MQGDWWESNFIVLYVDTQFSQHYVLKVPFILQHMFSACWSDSEWLKLQEFMFKSFVPLVYMSFNDIFILKLWYNYISPFFFLPSNLSHALLEIHDQLFSLILIASMMDMYMYMHRYMHYMMDSTCICICIPTFNLVSTYNVTCWTVWHWTSNWWALPWGRSPFPDPAFLSCL